MMTRDEDTPQAAEVHVAGVCIRPPIVSRAIPEILLQRRSWEPPTGLYPGKLEGCGGRMRPGESWTAALVRHYQDELGVRVARLPGLVELYEISEEGSREAIPGLRLACIPVGVPRELPERAAWYPLHAVAAMDPNDFAGECHDQTMRLAYAYLAERARGGRF